MDKALENEFDFEVVTEGSFTEQNFLVRTIVIRLNNLALNAYMKTNILNCRETYETEREWQEYQTEKAAMREDWENRILKKLNFIRNDQNSACIEKNVSEIFTVILMTQWKR